MSEDAFTALVLVGTIAALWLLVLASSSRRRR